MARKLHGQTGNHTRKEASNDQLTCFGLFIVIVGLPLLRDTYDGNKTIAHSLPLIDYEHNLCYWVLVVLMHHLKRQCVEGRELENEKVCI